MNNQEEVFNVVFPEYEAGAHVPELSFYIFEENYPYSKKRRITFSQNMIGILVEGRKEIYYETVYVSSESEHLLLLKSGSAITTEKSADNGKYKSIVFFFSDELLFEIFSRRFKNKVKTSSSADQCERSIAIQKDDFLLNYQDSLEILCEHMPVISNDLIKIKFEELICYLFERYPQQMSGYCGDVLGGNKGFNLKRIVVSNLNRNLKVEDLAFLCGMSVSTFKRRFNDVFGMPPKMYMIEYKMKMAIELLNQHYTPGDVCDKVGYQNLSAFSCEFKKRYGVSPKHYQDKLD